MIDPTIIGWQETWFGRYSCELTEWNIQPSHEIGFKIQQQIEYDIEKIIRNILVARLEPLKYKDIQPLVKDIYFAFDPEEQVQFKGQRIYKAIGDVEDWERQLAYEIRQRIIEKKQKGVTDVPEVY